MTATRLVLLSAVLLGAALSVSLNTNYYYELHGDMELTEQKMRQMYVEYGQEFQKPISFEEGSRFGHFKETLKTIAEHNANPNRSWEQGINKFADMSEEEFFSTHLGAAQDCSATEHNLKLIPQNDLMEDTNFDWRDQEPNPVTPVKNQGKCGSCWTFSTTGCLEAHWKIYKGETVYLSEQQLVDCAGDFDNHGCNGGLPSHAFEYIRYNNGLMSEQTYPYKAYDGVCGFRMDDVVAQVPQGSYNITKGDENELKQAVRNEGPVSVSFQVISGFKNYVSGVYSVSNCGTTTQDVNHAVLAVGYGMDSASGKAYWAVKNSWGENWGNGGYFNIERNVNMCAIAQCNSYPLVNEAHISHYEVLP